jgi:hypothetical protein
VDSDFFWRVTVDGFVARVAQQYYTINSMAFFLFLLRLVAPATLGVQNEALPWIYPIEHASVLLNYTHGIDSPAIV